MTRHSEGDGWRQYEVRGERNATIWVAQGSRVEVAPGVVTFEPLDFEAHVQGVEYLLTGRLMLDDPPSRYVLERFTLERAHADGREPGQPVTATGLRSIPLDFVLGHVKRNFATEGDGSGLRYDDAGNLVGEYGEKLRARGLGDELALRTVATVYLASSLSSDEPLASLAVFLECSIPTASRWVAAAKDAGYLQVASRRRRD